MKRITFSRRTPRETMEVKVQPSEHVDPFEVEIFGEQEMITDMADAMERGGATKKAGRAPPGYIENKLSDWVTKITTGKAN